MGASGPLSWEATVLGFGLGDLDLGMRLEGLLGEMHGSLFRV